MLRIKFKHLSFTVGFAALMLGLPACGKLFQETTSSTSESSATVENTVGDESSVGIRKFEPACRAIFDEQSGAEFKGVSQDKNWLYRRLRIFYEATKARNACAELGNGWEVMNESHSAQIPKMQCSDPIWVNAATSNQILGIDIGLSANSHKEGLQKLAVICMRKTSDAGASELCAIKKLEWSGFVQKNENTYAACEKDMDCETQILELEGCPLPVPVSRVANAVSLRNELAARTNALARECKQNAIGVCRPFTMEKTMCDPIQRRCVFIK